MLVDANQEQTLSLLDPLARPRLPRDLRRGAPGGAQVGALRGPAAAAVRRAAERHRPGDDPPASTWRMAETRCQSRQRLLRRPRRSRCCGRSSSLRVRRACSVVVSDHRKLTRYGYTAGLVGIVLLALPALLPSSLSEVNGAKVWLKLASFSIQPGEFAKILLMIFFASFLVAKRDLFMAASSKVLGVELPRGRDLGPILLAWVASHRHPGVREGPRHLAADLRRRPGDAVRRDRAGRLGGHRPQLFVGGCLHRLQPLHARPAARGELARPAGHLRQPGGGYQIAQGLFGLGTGGIGGTGLGAGRPDMVPEANTDFITAAIGEELGFIGLAAVLVLYLMLAHARHAQRARRARHVRQAARRRAGVRHGHADVRRRRRGHETHPGDRYHRPVPVLRWFVAAGELHPGRAAAPDLRRGPPPARPARSRSTSRRRRSRKRTPCSCSARRRRRPQA